MIFKLISKKFKIHNKIDFFFGNCRKELFIILLVLLFSDPVKSQHDADSLKNVLKVWNLKDDFAEEEIEYNDSSLEMFHTVRSDEKYSILTSNLGNIGSASISDIYFKRYDRFNNQFSFNEPYFIYLKNSRNSAYYNTRRPYTSIMHTTSSKVRDIQTIDFTHTQNIHPDFNFALNYDFVSSKGQYLDQSTKINSIGFTSNYKKERYFAYFSYTYNKLFNQNSGGYIDTIGADLEIATPRILNSNTSLQNQDLSFTQIYKLGKFKNLSYKDTIIKVLEPKISISHNITFQRKYRVYKDEEDESGGYYQNFNYQEDATNDSIGYKAMVNKIKIGSEEIFEKNKKFGFSLIIDAKYYEIFNFKRYFFLENSNTFFENNLYGEIYSSNFKKLYLKAYSKYYYSGYRSGDFRIGGEAKKYIFKNIPNSYIALNSKYTKQKADYFQNNFYSNHYNWENNFVPIETIDLSMSFNIPKNHFNLNVAGTIINDYIYFDGVKRPVQYDLGLSVISVSASKNFQFKRLHLHNKIVWQNSSDDNIISLPVIAAYHSTYFILNYNNSLLVHLGFDIYYSTEYKAASYNPAIGHFYFENDPEQMTGNYPNFSVFANLKIKRNVLLFFKYSNIYSIFSNSEEKKPVHVNHYPIYKGFFKFGVRWTFKN